MISLLVVNYRSAALAAEAVRSARSSTNAQVVIVDNSCDASEAAALRDLADVLIVSQTNRGYAGAINDGRRACTGDVIVISNPDVIFAPRAIELLAAALGAKTAVAGPALYWDDAHQWHLPPGDLLTAREKIDQVLASRSAKWRQQRDERRFRKRVAFWSVTETTPVRMLSGAVMAVRAADFDALGGFDERFPLYFEETDFLRRVSEHRKRIAYVPAAKVRHIYNQSASHDSGAAAARYAESEWKYLEKWCGPWLARVLKRAEKRRTGFSPSPPGVGGLKPAVRCITEASPLPTFETAAGFFGFAEDVPAEVKRSLNGAPLYLRYKIRP
ncbi:MAG TPA: glycosyltransferase [Thermoanaerobaculia bacterium]|nr:glycosyltransferase [Thermoanaerobaculia bacterium]